MDMETGITFAGAGGSNLLGSKCLKAASGASEKIYVCFAHFWETYERADGPAL